MKQQIYLDFNATAPIRPEVIKAVTGAMEEGGNPSSVHQAGRTARNRVEEARSQVAALVGSKAQEIIFTSGGTEANNLALSAMGDRPLFVSAVEHDSVLGVLDSKTATYLSVDSTGVLNLADLERILRDQQTPCFVSIMLANNETGVIQPIAEIATLIHEYGGLLHCDAIQAAGKIPIDFRALGTDMMSLSAHKLGGPQGMGALVLREGLAISPSLKGGGQELGRRAGTENVAGIVGFGVAAEIAKNGLEAYQTISSLRDKMEKSIHDISPDAVVYGEAAPRLPNTSTISMPGVAAELQVMNFDLAGIAVSAGSACSSGKVKASHVLKAMGASDEEAGSAIRVSLGWSTTEKEIEAFVENWEKLYRRKSPKFAA
ncbi:MAG: cysteine desulfurase [Proteobacteria bacterium]|nr:cysteine desulfurase [Pseudomonadota bacterium]